MGENSGRAISESSGKGAWLLFFGAVITATLTFIGVKYTADTNRDIALIAFSATQTAEAKITLAALTSTWTPSIVTQPTSSRLATNTHAVATPFPPIPTFTPTLAEDLRTIAFKAVPESLSINTETALYQKAQENNLGFAVSDEYRFSLGADTYVAQVYQRGIVYVKEGDWNNVRVTERISTPFTREPVANEVFRFSLGQHTITINPESLLMKEAQIRGLGHPLTSEFDFSFRDKTYVGQLFTGGLICAMKGRSTDVVVFTR